jgi:hypothetical protein
MFRYSTIALVSLVSFLALPTRAQDFNHRLNGDYAVSTTSLCAQNQAGFTADGQALAPVTLLSRAIETTRSYDGNGGLTITGHSFQVSTPAGPFPTTEADFTCTGTYEVNADDSFTENETCSGTVATGSVAGQTFTQSVTTPSGQLRGKTIILKETHAMPPVVVTLSAAGAFSRLCGTSGSGVKIKK